MKRRLAMFALMAAAFGAISGSAEARTRIVSQWNGHGIGSYYVSHPKKLGLVMAGTGYQGYWLIRDVRWKHWGNRRTKAKGELASAALAGTPVVIRARRHTYRSCVRAGDRLHFYTRAKIRIKGQSDWMRIPHKSLAPQCNNLRGRSPLGGRPTFEVAAPMQRSSCSVISIGGTRYVFSKRRIGCERAKDYAQHVGRTRGRWQPPRWRCESGSGFKTGGSCKNGKHWFAWYPGD